VASFLAMQANDSVDVLVRRRLRELRVQRDLTLEDVAQKSADRRIYTEPFGVG
jgi:hypothetical protein